MIRIDAHQHFWTPGRSDYGWLTPALPTLYREFKPDDLAPLLGTRSVEGTVLIQAAPSEAETDFLLSIADRTHFVRAVVGWIDLSRPAPAESLERFAAHPCFRGIRPMLQDERDIGWLLDPRLVPVFEALEARDLTFDALIRPHQLPTIVRLLERHPRLRVVVDHGAKPAIATRAWEPWASNLAAAAECPNAFVKLSGLLTEAVQGEADSARPYADHLLNCFGTERVMWGSDWPMLLLATDYQSWFDKAWDWCSGDRDKVFGGNAGLFYHIGENS